MKPKKCLKKPVVSEASHVSDPVEQVEKIWDLVSRENVREGLDFGLSEMTTWVKTLEGEWELIEIRTLSKE